MIASPEDFRPVLAKALVLQEQGDNDAAQPLFDQATTMAPAQFKDQIQQMASQADPSLPLDGEETAGEVEALPGAEDAAPSPSAEE